MAAASAVGWITTSTAGLRRRRGQATVSSARAARTAEHDRFDEELIHHVLLARAYRLAYPYLFRALDDRYEHDVHYHYAAYYERYPYDWKSDRRHGPGYRAE